MGIEASARFKCDVCGETIGEFNLAWEGNSFPFNEVPFEFNLSSEALAALRDWRRFHGKMICSPRCFLVERIDSMEQSLNKARLELEQMDVVLVKGEAESCSTR